MDITIIGGGIAGLVGALTSARAGHRVMVYETSTVGSGTSGKALGLLVPVTGLNRPIDLLQREGISRWPEIAAHIAQVTAIPLISFYRPWGGGNHQLRLPLLFSLLKAAIEHHGGTVLENTPPPAAAIPHTHRTPHRVIYAAGYANKNLINQPLTLSAGIACRMRGQLNELICKDNLFLAPDWDGTILAGSLNWTLQDMPENPHQIPDIKSKELLERIAKIAPKLELLDMWIGYRPVQTPRTPLLSEVSPNVFAVTGLGKIGLGLSPMLNFQEPV